MSTAFPSGSEVTEPGVTTRSRKRLRDGAVPSSPAADSFDRKKPKAESVPVALRRSSRHAAIVSSRRKRENSPTRQDQALDFETPPTSRSTSLVDEESETLSVSASQRPLPREGDNATSQDDSNTGPHSSGSTLPSTPIPWKTYPSVDEIIDLTDPPTGQKRKRPTVGSDDIDPNDAGEEKPMDETLRRVTRSSAKKARLDGSAQNEAAVCSPPARRVRAARPVATRRRSSRSLVQAPSMTDSSELHIASLSLSEPDADIDVGTPSEEQELPGADQCAPPVQEVLDSSWSSETFCTTAVDGSDPRDTNFSSPMEIGPVCPGAAQPAPLAPTVSLGSAAADSDRPNSTPEAAEETSEAKAGTARPSVELDVAFDSTAPSSSKDGLELNSYQDADLISDDIVTAALEMDTAMLISPESSQPEAEATSLPAEDADIPSSVSQSDTDELLPVMAENTSCPRRPVDGSVDVMAPTPSISSRAGPSSDSSSDHPRCPKSPPFAYFGVDVRFLRFRNPPTSYLAPNPVRRAPKHPTVRRDQFRYLPDATEKAGLLAFAQTRRQFPRWMKRPSRNYFVGTKFIPRGEPATEQHMDPEEIGVGMDIDGVLASSAARDIFLLPQTELYPSESSYTTPQMELDPDLDPSSLLNGQSMFYAQGGTSDFLGAGPSSTSSAPYAASSSYQQREHSPQGRLWAPHGMPSQLQDGFASGEAPLAGSSSAQGSTFHPGGSGMPLGSAQAYAQDMPWDPANWANSPQFALFGVPVPPLPLPAQNMSMDSSLSAMATYFVNDGHKTVDPTVIDGMPPAPPTHSQFAHSPIQHLDSNSTPDTYQSPPAN